MIVVLVILHLLVVMNISQCWFETASSPET